MIAISKAKSCGKMLSGERIQERSGGRTPDYHDRLAFLAKIVGRIEDGLFAYEMDPVLLEDGLHPIWGDTRDIIPISSISTKSAC